jgi:phosphoribosylanthranilate isomerase
MRLLKISHIKNIYEARSIAELGVDFMGLHLVTREHLERLGLFRNINTMLRREFPDTKSVMVTKERNIERIIELIEKTGCQAVEIHYHPTPGLFAMLRSYFGQRLVIFGVTSSLELQRPADFALANYVIINKNYVGGTGEQIPQQKIPELLEVYKNQNAFLAGGIDADTVRKLRIVSNISGYDVQSSVMSDRQSDFENIDYKKLNQLVAAIRGKLPEVTPSKYATMHTVLANEEPVDYFNKYDILRFDFYDNIEGKQTPVEQQVKKITELAKLNSHLHIEVHTFSTDTIFADKITKATKPAADKVKRFEVQAH